MNSGIKTVGVVGAGTMGSGIAQVFARAGFRVVLCDVEMSLLERAVVRIRENLVREAAKGKLTDAEIESALERIRATMERDCLAEADFAIEAASERFEIKAEVFRALDELMAPSAVLATNTSSISIARLAGETGRPDKVIGMHFFNPVPRMVLVEVVRGPETSEATLELVRALCAVLGKTPVEVSDAPGFVSNRVLMPMINEAAYAVMEGVATAESVDRILKLGMAHPMGPLALADLIGIDVCVDIMRVLEQGLGSSKYSPCPLLVRLAEEGKLGRKAGRGFYEYGTPD